MVKENKERLVKLATERDPSLMNEIEVSNINRAWLKESFMVGIRVLAKLEEIGWTQKDLANAMNVSPQQVNKIVRGRQNLTLETLVKLQQALHLPILVSYLQKQTDFG